MNEMLTPLDMIILLLCACTRGMWPEMAVRYGCLKAASNPEAIRKRMERLCDKGFLAHSKLPSGLRIFRLTHKGVALMNAPKAFASSPTLGIAVEMLSVASFAAKSEEFVFPTHEEMNAVLSELTGTNITLKVPGRFVWRFSGPAPDTAKSDVCFHYWLAEPPRPADKLAKRVQVVFEKLIQNKAIADLVELGLFGFTVVVPSEGFRATFNTYRFPVETDTVVLPLLQPLFATDK